MPATTSDLMEKAMHSNTSPPRHWHRPSPASFALCLFGLGLVLAAVLAPAVQQPTHYHAFADQRVLFGIPHAMDVLSNLPFLLLALLGLSRLPQMPDPRWRSLALLMCLGLLFTFAGSSVYHLSPSDPNLLYDRLGMLVLFAAILSLATADRLGLAAASGVLLAVALGGAASLWAWQASDNLLPWVLLQAGGMLVLAALAFCRPQPGGYGLRLGLCVAWYALAKLFELGDEQLFHLSGELLSGHSIKHVLSAGAVLPLWLPLVASRYRG
ncbi:hypothetical protein HNE05_03185 [Aquipseudomonas campi]|uniref:Alkaline phytoceramidase n=1 Tax=Aquipseudomonas campi TaxID=2731681 RepID=A0A6M8F588_9GAMM|nr:hypothetical protein [Pseudomonas campi]QKE62401.1 hypothetical protein HNE05_03185 [Pseudomonas campi]